MRHRLRDAARGGIGSTWRPGVQKRDQGGAETDACRPPSAAVGAFAFCRRLQAHAKAVALRRLAFLLFGMVHLPGVLLGASYRLFLKVHRLGFLCGPFGKLKRLGSLPA